MKFNFKIQELRKQHGFSQEKLAELIGVSRQAVAKWKSGSTYPEVDKLVSISNLFGVSIDKLLKDIEDKCGKKEIRVSNSIDDRIINFLCEAKKETYAGGGKEVEPSRPNSHDLVYCKENYKYIDSYLGEKDL